MGTLWQDIKYGIRMLMKNPGFTLTVVMTLALGIGAVTTMASVFWSVALRPLPFEEPERLVFAQAVTDQGNRNSLSAMDYFDYRQQCDAFESVVAVVRIVRSRQRRVPSLYSAGASCHTNQPYGGIEI